MAVNDSYTKATDGLADAGDLIIDGSGSDTGALNITELGGGGSANVYREVDTADDGSWAVSVQVDTTSGTWHSQENEFIVSQTQNVRLRINNTSGGTADFFAVGYEVDD